MSVEAMRVFAMTVGTLTAFTASRIMAAMDQHAANDEWPGATLVEVCHAARTASNLAKEPATQVQLVADPGRCMVSKTPMPLM